MGFRACNYVWLAAVNQTLYNIMNEEPSLCCCLEAGRRLPVLKSMQLPSAVRCLENSGFSGRGQLCGDLTSFPDTSQVDAHFHCHDKVMRGFSWVVLFPEVCRWNDFYSWKAGTKADSSDSLTWAAASTLLRPSPSPLSLPPQSHFVLLNVDPMILSHQHLNYLPPCSSQ